MGRPHDASSDLTPPSEANRSELGSGPELAAVVIDQLRAHGSRMTVLRRLVIEELAAATTHLTAEALLERLRQRVPDAHLATVYRNLEALLEAGVATHVHLPHGATTYHLKRPGRRSHLHVVCRRCDSVIDLEADALDDVAAELDGRHGFQLDSHHVALTGHCQGCRQETIGGDGNR